MATNEITLSLGSYSVTVYSDNISEEYSNKIFQITPAKGKDTQSTGPNDVKIVNLLRVQHQIKVKGYISASSTKSAEEVKDDLVKIFLGGKTDGEVVTLSYSNGIPMDISKNIGDNITGFIEKLVIIEESNGLAPTEAGTDSANFTVDMTFVEGTTV